MKRSSTATAPASFISPQNGSRDASSSSGAKPPAGRTGRENCSVPAFRIIWSFRRGSQRLSRSVSPCRRGPRGNGSKHTAESRRNPRTSSVPGNMPSAALPLLRMNSSPNRRWTTCSSAPVPSPCAAERSGCTETEPPRSPKRNSQTNLLRTLISVRQVRTKKSGWTSVPEEWMMNRRAPSRSAPNGFPDFSRLRSAGKNIIILRSVTSGRTTRSGSKNIRSARWNSPATHGLCTCGRTSCSAAKSIRGKP